MYKCVGCKHVTDHPVKEQRSVTMVGRTFEQWVHVCPLCGVDVIKLKDQKA